MNPPDQSFSRTGSSYSGQMLFRNSVFAASVGAGSASTSAVPKSLGRTVSVREIASPLTVMRISWAPAEAL